MRLLLSTYFIFCAIMAFSQPNDSLDYSKNLVINYSFESHGYTPCGRIGVGDYSKFNIDNWAWASYASSDIFNTESEIRCFSYVSDPSNQFQFTTYGTIMPRTGNIMLGIYCNGIYRGTEYHEYIITKLDQPLIPENEYYVEFWVCRSARSYYITNNIGACFTTDPVFYKNTRSIHAKPNIVHKEIIRSGREWTKISGYYAPSDTMNYMLIGNFTKDKDCEVVSARDGSKAKDLTAETYYLIDDVYVLPAGDTADYQEVIVEKSEYEKIEVNEAVILKNVFFKHDKSNILPESFPELDKLADFLKNNPSVTLEISGHTDNTGSDKYNTELSLARAKAVRQYVIEKDIMDTRISFRGYASIKPIADNNTEEGRATNRRVEFKIMKK